MKNITGFPLLTLIAFFLAACAAQPQPPAMPEPTQSNPAGEIAITWHREGGIAGFCDNLTVSTTGIVIASSCKGNRTEEIGRSQLTPEQLKKMEAWVDSYESFDFQHKDAATADAMILKLVFTGKTDRPASNSEKQAILDFMSDLFSSLALAPTS
jgi:hypothetical protein